jgi:hypothetical protein
MFLPPYIVKATFPFVFLKSKSCSLVESCLNGKYCFSSCCLLSFLLCCVVFCVFLPFSFLVRLVLSCIRVHVFPSCPSLLVVFVGPCVFVPLLVIALPVDARMIAGVARSFPVGMRPCPMSPVSRLPFPTFLHL